MNGLTDVAILAYRQERFAEAIELLACETQRDPKNWLAWLYLGNAYERRGLLHNAFLVFNRLAKECPEEPMHFKAVKRLEEVGAAMMKSGCAFPKRANDTPTQAASESSNDVMEQGCG